MDLSIICSPQEVRKRKNDEENYNSSLVENPIKKKRVESLDDFIKFAYNYNGRFLNKDRLTKLIPPLKELRDVVGMKKVKEEVVRLLMYYISNLHLVKDKKEDKMVMGEGDYLNIVLEGPPGAGKTMIAQILGKIFCAMGFLSKGTFKSVKGVDFKGNYIGQSENKTKKLLEESLGCVLFIDEAYSFGSEHGQCPYSKAAIDVLNPFLSENKNDFVCIVAGYKEDLKKYFFSLNAGLERRFPWRFQIEEYSPEEMLQLLKLKVKNIQWSLADNAIDASFFSINKQYFPFYGGDIDAFITKIKSAHSKRIFGNDPKSHKIITNEDIIEGFKSFKDHRDNEDKMPDSVKRMYGMI